MKKIRQYLFVIEEMTAREIKRKYVRSSLGIIWSILNPLLHMIVISMIFSYMFRRSIENFPIYYLTGNILWGLFSTATNTAMSALVDNKRLLVRTKIPKQVFILSRIYTALVNFGYTCIAYVLMLVVFRIKITPYALLMLPDMLLMLLFATGVSYILATAYVFFADIKYLYSVLLQLLMYLSALFYPVKRLPIFMQGLIGYNPIYETIYIARCCVMYGELPELQYWLRLVIWTILALVMGMLVFRRRENYVMEKI